MKHDIVPHTNEIPFKLPLDENSIPPHFARIVIGTRVIIVTLAPGYWPLVDICNYDPENCYLPGRGGANYVDILVHGYFEYTPGFDDGAVNRQAQIVHMAAYGFCESPMYD